ncbi:MAG TPA: glutamyl-tRNA reductase [Gaiellales bacterium]|jgi:glutamyl-tRNA reductase|nr:glutamyl-tRNA reductase [Gaiellales bacterium]
MASAAQLVLVGTNHTRAPLAVRERLAAHDHGRELLQHLTGSADVAEAVGLSTCNRCELYMVGADAAAMRAAAVEGLGALSGHAVERLEPMLYVHHGEPAARHLFGVAGGLDSMVPGEAQILAQIREAYESACEWDTTGPVTNRLFHQALEAGKRVRHETAIGEGGASPASVAAELVASRLGVELASAHVLVVGAGRVAELVAANLSARGVASIAVANRDSSRAAALASRFGGRPVELSELRQAIAAADVVVASTASPEPLIGLADVPPGRRVLIDLAVPRDIDPAVAGVDGVSLHTIDDLEAVVARTISLRQGEADRGREIVAAHASGFRDWMAALEVVPAITSLRAHAERIRQAELERARLGDLSPAERERLDSLTRGIVNKLLHRPTVRLKQLAAEDESGPYAEAVTELFGLAAVE